MMRFGIREYPRAFRAALAIHENRDYSFPLNVSTVLESIGTHKIYDVSSRTYNSTFVASEREMVRPQKAWTIFNEQLDTYLVVWNAAPRTASIRFSVAHEIGHIVLNHQRSWPTDLQLKKQHMENEANVFAGCLLAPFHAIQALCGSRLPTQRMIADRFDIPSGPALGIQRDYEYWLLERPAADLGQAEQPAALLHGPSCP